MTRSILLVNDIYFKYGTLCRDNKTIALRGIGLVEVTVFFLSRDYLETDLMSPRQLLTNQDAQEKGCARGY